MIPAFPQPVTPPAAYAAAALTPTASSAPGTPAAAPATPALSAHGVEVRSPGEASKGDARSTGAAPRLADQLDVKFDKLDGTNVTIGMTCRQGPVDVGLRDILWTDAGQEGLGMKPPSLYNECPIHHRVGCT